ncbi:GAF domain-containing protein [Arthrobacter sp. UYCu712]|uniref:GAF domain-containing protein n=1 Tax=Arthrobacter sp. UYCu712 TaxID=3156340 RepID=UPI00339B6401
MTEDIAAASGPERRAAAWEMPFDSRDVGAFLHEVVGEFVEDTGGSSRGISWALTIFRAGQVITLAAGSAPARAVDEAQISFEDSPSRTALRDGELVLVPDIGLERRWPGYASTAAGLGVCSLMAVPLVPTDVFHAVLGLYAPWPHVFTSDDMTAAVRFTRELSRDLRLAQGLALGAQSEAELSSAQLSRTLAGLVVRTLVREHGFSVEASLDYLRLVAGNLPRPEDGPLQVLVPAADQDLRGIPAGPGLRTARSVDPHLDSHPARRKRRRTGSPA